MAILRTDMEEELPRGQGEIVLLVDDWVQKPLDLAVLTQTVHRILVR